MKLFELISSIEWEWHNERGDEGEYLAEFNTPNGLKYLVEFTPVEEKWYDDVLLQYGLKDFLEKHGLLSTIYGKSTHDVRAFNIDFTLLYDNGEISHKTTGTGEAKFVISTVVDIVKSFVGLNVADVLIFTAELSEPSRVKLYDFLARKIVQGGWAMETSLAPDTKHYFFVRNQ